MKLQGIKKTIGNFQLSVDELLIEEGKIHGLVGHNGAGKSILLKIIMGIMERDAGDIDYGSISQSEITLMTQTPYLLHTSVYENVVYPLKLRKIKPDEEEVDKLLERAGMLAHKEQYALSLSSGERQKLSFLRAVIFKPKLIMMDETLSNLDPDSENTIIEMMKEIQDERQATWIIVSHQLESKGDLCDIIHRMEGGKMVV